MPYQQEQKKTITFFGIEKRLSGEIRTPEVLDTEVTDEFYFLNQPGQVDIQTDLFYDYRSNEDAYPRWQAWMREKHPRLLVVWGKYESSFG